MLPYTTFESVDPENLWDWMENYEQKTGDRVLAIPHNGNLSNGLMFAFETYGGEPLTGAYAQRRQRYEPIYEITQIKGDGEAHPLLSPDDEFADFETWDWGNLDLTEKKTPEMLATEYPRLALLNGMKFEENLGANPFKFGFVGASDTHTGLSTPDNDNFFGKFTSYEPNPHRIDHLSKENKDLGIEYYSWRYITGGLTAVWATENTREAIWDAMQRRETYATTGPRMRVRFFGSFNFEATDANSRNLASVGYAKGVPMGGELSAAPADQAPAFLVYALRDPVGANLDRLQIVKGWLDEEGNPQEEVYDVAWSGDRKPGQDGKLPAVGNTVDLSVPTWLNTIGASELGTVWRDPDFDPDLKAFYYARVIEIPTPRWTAYDAKRYNVKLSPEVWVTIQERAYTSPIWYNPDK
jgi:hypothetical protein